MDFLSYIRDQKDKLNSLEYVTHLWDELEGNSAEADINPNAVNDFNKHLPLLLEQFWEIALEKLDQADVVDDIDQDLKIYLLVLLYQCMTQSHEAVSLTCVLHASGVYLHLLTIPQSDEFYRSKLYRTTLITLQSSVEAAVSENLISCLIHKLRCFLKKAKFNTSDLETTLATLVQIIFLKTKEIFQNFDIIENVGSVNYEALLSMKILYEEESVQSRKFLILTYMFNGLKKHSTVHTNPRNFNIIQVNFRNLLKSLHLKFKEDKYRTFLNAFIHTWKHVDFNFYGEGVLIMNSLKGKYYQTLLDILNKMLTSRNPNKNLFKLSLSIICFPPKHTPLEKVKVTNEILLKSILFNCISSKNEVSNCAVESLAEILMSPDLNNEFVREPVKKILNCENEQNMNVPMLLRGFQSLMSKKWGTRSKNKHLFVIIISIMYFSEEDYSGIYREILEFLTEQCSPYDLKPFISLLSETYLQLIDKDYKFSAFQILKIIFRMALHPMASSTEFVKFLYSSMVYPNVCKGTTIRSDLFIDSIISDDLKFSEFFQKCRTLGLIKTEHAARLIGNLSNITPSNLKLLCAIIHLTEYKDLSIIADHISDHFTTICNSPHLNYLLYVYNQIYKSNSSTRSNQNLRSNEVMLTFIKHHLLRQSLRWNSVANAFALLKTLEEGTSLDEDFARFKQQYDNTLTTTLRHKKSYIPLLYYSQLVIFGRILPSEDNQKAVTDFLALCADEYHRRSPEFNPKIWIGCLLLYTNICVIKTNLVETCIDHLKNGLCCSINVVKLTSINLAFDLCNMVTHNFEDLINYMFKELLYGDSVFKKTCLLKIDRLIRDDYLKLELEQFLIFVSILGDKDVGLRDYLKQLMCESFFVSNSTLIARHFVPLIVHINGYKKHPNYRISKHGYELMQVVSRNVLDRRKIYGLLFSSLPIKIRFSLIHILSTQILEHMMHGKIKVDEGFWKMIKDSVYIFKLLGLNSNEDELGENFYKKIVGHISKFILQKAELADKSLHIEYHKEIIKGTETLLKLFFFNDNDNVQQYIGLSVFDAIIHWTNFLMPDLVHIVHVERCKDIQNSFAKFEKLYKKNTQNFKYGEESFENRVNGVNQGITHRSPMFNVVEEYVPELDR